MFSIVSAKSLRLYVLDRIQTYKSFFPELDKQIRGTSSCKEVTNYIVAKAYFESFFYITGKEKIF